MDVKRGKIFKGCQATENAQTLNGVKHGDIAQREKNMEVKIKAKRKKMATGTFTYNALRTKTLKERIKAQRKIVSHSNSTRAMLLV